MLRVTTSASRQRFSFDIGRVSTIRHRVARARLALFVVRVKFLRDSHHARVQLVLHQPRHLHDDRLLHLRAGHDAGQFLALRAARMPLRVLPVFQLPSVLPQFALAQQCFDARQILARRAQLGDRFGLPGRKLKAQPENLLGQLVLPLVQFGVS